MNTILRSQGEVGHDGVGCCVVIVVLPEGNGSFLSIKLLVDDENGDDDPLLVAIVRYSFTEFTFNVNNIKDTQT